LRRLAARLGLEVPMEVVQGPEAAACFDRALPVYPVELAADVTPGQPDPANGPAVLAAIEAAVALVQADRAAAVVTNPIHKQVLYRAGFAHPGHTEFLAALVKSPTAPVMMLACPGLRVVPVTVHLPLATAAASLTTEAIVHCGRVTCRALAQDFGIERPHLAVAGLNPHAGESGSIGREEIEIVAPAVAALRAEGFSLGDPAPADSLFHPAARARYDAVLCMYHDQALIPLKTIDFDRGVNITLGLPIVRTSPDHGTACDIAGRGIADHRSLLEALRTARAMADARRRVRQEASLP
ncbi:MAG TPA: 4-hydroxythreonine-4-phosphate dehydrogenase PdxA, partial [Kiloniellaceae bacterium]|nr:4-hydroxythreonine-4-phosphate dehydrogenase PdxA [Kiloniellaceae bacterium]